MKALFDRVSIKCSKITTNNYSTSFSLGIKLLNKKFHDPIYAIYGFVRFADEIVDTFHTYDKENLLRKFRADTKDAIRDKISLNPILNSFQKTVHHYGIKSELIDIFLRSMEMDLSQSTYSHQELKDYVLGSAEAVGLMCLCVFCERDRKMYEDLKYHAMQLGSAFQKINFLRDLKNDYLILGRTYFPEVDFEMFDESTKKKIERQIEEEFHQGYLGIKRLPKSARFGVYVAYAYYYSLFKKIQNISSNAIVQKRIRIPNQKKYALLLGSYLRHSFNLL